VRKTTNVRLVPGLSDQQIGLEARAAPDDHLSVKVWLRLLACSAQIEQELRQRLRVRFGTTLARFDYLAQLERRPEGLRMNALSRYLMVTSGNTTALTDQLVKDGLVVRESHPDDRRSYRVTLTPRGRRQFAVMAAEHEQWLTELFEGFGVANKETLYQQLGRLRAHLAHKGAQADPEPVEPPLARRSRP
jgi:DNA-binding MarR family transcriptional regulator